MPCKLISHEHESQENLERRRGGWVGVGRRHALIGKLKIDLIFMGVRIGTDHRFYDYFGKSARVLINLRTREWIVGCSARNHFVEDFPVQVYLMQA